MLKADCFAKHTYYTAEAKRILQELRNLNRLNGVHDSPASPSHIQQYSPDSFAELLESVYASSANCHLRAKIQFADSLDSRWLN